MLDPVLEGQEAHPRAFALSPCPFSACTLFPCSCIADPTCDALPLQAGDHLQLPPTLKSSDRLTKKLSSKDTKPSSSPTPPALPNGKLSLSPDLEVTLFSRLLAMHGPTIRRMLKVQYRFNRKICTFPSRELYDGELVPDPSVEDRKLSDLEGVEADEDIDEPVIFIDSASLEPRVPSPILPS